MHTVAHRAKGKKKLKDERTYLHQKQACSSSTHIEQITIKKIQMKKKPILLSSLALKYREHKKGQKKKDKKKKWQMIELLTLLHQKQKLE
jgi:hypothetical protein